MDKTHLHVEIKKNRCKVSKVHDRMLNTNNDLINFPDHRYSTSIGQFRSDLNGQEFHFVFRLSLMMDRIHGYLELMLSDCFSVGLSTIFQVLYRDIEKLVSQS